MRTQGNYALATRILAADKDAVLTKDFEHQNTQNRFRTNQRHAKIHWTRVVMVKPPAKSHEYITYGGLFAIPLCQISTERTHVST